eukprot:3694699-Karenia_brevis.AAC.1
MGLLAVQIEDFNPKEFPVFGKLIKDAGRDVFVIYMPPRVQKAQAQSGVMQDDTTTSTSQMASALADSPAQCVIWYTNH